MSKLLKMAAAVMGLSLTIGLSVVGCGAAPTEEESTPDEAVGVAHEAACLNGWHVSCYDADHCGCCRTGQVYDCDAFGCFCCSGTGCT